MQHTKFQGNRSSGSEEEEFLRFLPHMDMAAILVINLDQIYCLSPFAWRLHMKSNCNWPCTFRENFERHLTSDLWPRSPNEFDLQREGMIISKRTTATEKYTFFQPFPFKSLRDQIWPCHKISHGQPRVIIYIYFKELTPQMLHTKFQGNQPSGSGEEDFFKVFTIYGHGSHLGHVQTFFPPLPEGCIWNLIEIGPAVSEEKSFEDVEGRQIPDNRKQRLPSYKLPQSPWLRGAKNPG